MYKKVITILIFGFLIIGVAQAADFKINDGFAPQSEYYAVNNETDMILYTWDYDDEIIRTSYLANDTDYTIISGDNNTYNVSYYMDNKIGNAISYVSSGKINVDYGVLEIAEIDGIKHVFMVYKERGTPDDWKNCYDELMKFNENNNIEPLADAI